jgi:hypothetical protein
MEGAVDGPASANGATLRKAAQGDQGQAGPGQGQAAETYAKNKQTEESGMIDIRRFASMGENPLDKLETSYKPDMAGEIDTLADEWADELDLAEWQHQALILLMAEYQLREARETASKMLIPILTYLNEPRGNKTLRYYAFLLAAGDTSITLAHSYSELARKIGVTRAALSKAVIEMQEKLGLKGHNNFQKSDAARESSRKAAHRSWQKRHNEEENTPE